VWSLENLYEAARSPGERVFLNLEHPSKSATVNSLIKDAGALQVTVDKKRKALCADEETLQNLHKEVDERKGRTKLLRALIDALC
jgi:hypothetical protein